MMEDRVAVYLTPENIAATAEKAGLTEDSLWEFYRRCLADKRLPALKYFPKSERFDGRNIS
jgi:hypothetical protein